jgi:hypothetical protein
MELGDRAAICSRVCTSPEEATIEAAIARLTRALATAGDAAIENLVTERASLREELRAMRESRAGIARVEVRRVSRR